MSTPNQPSPVSVPHPQIYKEALPYDEQNQQRLPVYYKEMVNHVADITMRLGSRGPLGAGLAALYTTFPLMSLKGLAQMIDTEWAQQSALPEAERRQFVAFAAPTNWGMNPLWWAANRGDPGVIASVLFHEADHIVNNDALTQIKLIKALGKAGVATVKPGKEEGKWVDSTGFSMEHAAAWVSGYHNRALDLFCDDTTGVNRESAENLDMGMLRNHQLNMCESLTGSAKSIVKLTGIPISRDAHRILNRLDIIKTSGETQELQRLEWSLMLATALPIVDMSQSGGGAGDPGDGEGQGESGGEQMSAPGDDSQPLGDVKSNTPTQGSGDEQTGSADNSSKGMAAQAEQMSDEDIDKAGREHDAKMKTAARMAGNSPLFESFRMRIMDEAKRDYKSILAEGLTLSAYSKDGKKTLARPYLPDLSRRMIRPTAQGEPTVQALAFLDTSDSMYWGAVGNGGESEAVIAVREMLALIKTTPLDLMVILPVDAQVHKPLVLERDMSSADGEAMAAELMAATVEGGGGTAFDPPFTWLANPPKEHAATVRSWRDMSEGGPPFSACIYYTDGHGRLPSVEQVTPVQNFWGGGAHLYWCMPKDSPIQGQIRATPQVYGRALWMN